MGGLATVKRPVLASMANWFAPLPEVIENVDWAKRSGSVAENWPSWVPTIVFSKIVRSPGAVMLGDSFTSPTVTSTRTVSEPPVVLEMVTNSSMVDGSSYWLERVSKSSTALLATVRVPVEELMAKAEPEFPELMA